MKRMSREHPVPGCHRRRRPRRAPCADAADPIPVGVAVAQTSNIALFGQEQIIGAQIAEEFFNQKGGVNGRPVKLVFQDTAGDEAGAINAFQNLINVAKVVAIVGPTLSQQAFAADPIANKAGVPVVGPSNTAQGIPQIGEYISRVSAPVTQIAPHAVKAAMDMNPNLKRVAVLFAQNDAFSKSETQVFQATVKENPKLELVTVQTFQTTDTDFTAADDQRPGRQARPGDHLRARRRRRQPGEAAPRARVQGPDRRRERLQHRRTSSRSARPSATASWWPRRTATRRRARSTRPSARSTRRSRRRSRRSSAASPSRRSRW